MLNLYRCFMYKINFNHLKYFLTIAEEGSIVKASKRLNITQPALSHQLRLLEEDLEKKLFDRLGKKLVLNDNGIVVMEYARKIFRHSEEMIQYLKSNNDDFITIIKVGTVPWVPNDVIYDFLKPLIINPHLKIQIYQKDLDSLYKDIANNKLDLILSDTEYTGRSKKLIAHKLKAEPLVCVAASKNSFKGKFPNCLSNKKVINYPEICVLGRNIEDYFEINNLSVKIVSEFTDSSLIKSAVEHGGVAAFLPRSVVKQSLKEKRLIKLGQDKNLVFNLWAITSGDISKENALAQRIVKYRGS
ncbi:LysR family transcriptional regulator [Halobacteriovorax vibrionivorans]|uniref:LysR family transcriptional regulator n=2 Tax=Halobacteriovoraceae TaxID=1652132 RepID=A0ABY0IF18_9BACT|nr:LysR family transcriptional regulator [Halobacteriovorax vibrionivorans]TGD49169.1 LysR family transcriptional regulator [Halobacteriovorax sp. Y22]